MSCRPLMRLLRENTRVVEPMLAVFEKCGSKALRRLAGMMSQKLAQNIAERLGRIVDVDFERCGRFAAAQGSSDSAFETIAPLVYHSATSGRRLDEGTPAETSARVSGSIPVEFKDGAIPALSLASAVIS